jgi:hypothetical protein
MFNGEKNSVWILFSTRIQFNFFGKPFQILKWQQRCRRAAILPIPHSIFFNCGKIIQHKKIVACVDAIAVAYPRCSFCCQL